MCRRALLHSRGHARAFRDGTKLTATMLEDYAATIPVSLNDAYGALAERGPGANMIRAEMANLFNKRARKAYIDSCPFLWRADNVENNHRRELLQTLNMLFFILTRGIQNGKKNLLRCLWT